MSVKLDGDWKRIQYVFSSLIRTVDELAPSIQSEGDSIVGEMQREAPVDTGFLRDHIVKENIPEGVKVESQAGYSGFLEYGTCKMFPRPFFRLPLWNGWVRISRKLREKFIQSFRKVF